MTNSRILIVENEPMVAEGIQACLKGFDYDVVGVAGTGERALEMARDMLPDLTLMDINLDGDLDGTQVAKIIRSRYGIPVIYLTACADEVTLQRAKSTVPLGFLLKPFNERELRSSVEIALYRRQLEKNASFDSDWNQHAINSLGDEIIATDQNNQVKFMNCAAERITGWFFIEAHERQLSEILNLKRSDASRIISQSSHSDQPNQRSNVHISGITLIQSDGRSMLPVDVIANPIRDAKNDRIGTSLILRSVEDTWIDNNNNPEIQQTNLVDEKMAALQELVEGLAHGINNSLSGSLGFLELLRRYGKISDEFQKWADSAISGCRDAAQLINKVRSTCSSIPIRTTRLELNEVVNTLVEQLTNRVDENVSVRFVPAPSPTMIDGDRSQIEQVILNLIFNAALAMPQGGEVEVSITNESLQPVPTNSQSKDSQSKDSQSNGHNNYAVVAVKDSGVGIAPESISRIFDPFYTTIRDGKVFGKGLGLTLAYAIMKGHGGWINVESAESAGSIFRLFFPEIPSEIDSRSYNSQ